MLRLRSFHPFSLLIPFPFGLLILSVLYTVLILGLCAVSLWSGPHVAAGVPSMRSVGQQRKERRI